MLGVDERPHARRLDALPLLRLALLQHRVVFEPEECRGALHGLGVGTRPGECGAQGVASLRGVSSLRGVARPGECGAQLLLVDEVLDVT